MAGLKRYQPPYGPARRPGRLTTFLLGAAFVLALTFSPGFMRPASAHPHVWVLMRSALVYAPDGTLTGIRQSWTFDEAFSAFALQGLERKADGSYGDDVLKPLAELNISSLKESGYFVTAKTATAKIPLKDPQEYNLTFADDALTLHFTLPLARPVPGHGTVSLDIYDPELFIAFEFAPQDAVQLMNPPAGCTAQVTSPTQNQKPMQLSEAFFENLTQAAEYSAQIADKVIVKCP